MNDKIFSFLHHYNNQIRFAFNFTHLNIAGNHKTQAYL